MSEKMKVQTQDYPVTYMRTPAMDRQIRKEIGADSLSFISLEGMMSALDGKIPSAGGFCRGCFCGEYPVG